MNNDDPDLIYGCGHSCVFRFPKVGGVATNGDCKCATHKMSPIEAAKLRKKIRDLVNYAAVLREEHKENQRRLIIEKPDPNEIIHGC